MASKRMMISMTPELHKLLFEYSEATGQPAARCVVDLLEELKPQLKKSVELIRLARLGRLKDATAALQELSADLMQLANTANDDVNQLELPWKRRDE